MDIKHPHRWSGWPGAWCLDCGIADPAEEALAEGKLDVTVDPATGEYTGIVYDPGVREEILQKSECPEPNSKRHDPYARLGNDDKKT